MNRMKIIFTLIIGFLAFASQADARLGETKEQCERRYGEVSDITANPKLNGYFYIKNNYTIVAYFIEGVCQRIDYTKEDYSGRKVPLSEKEIEVFLSSNAQNSKWIAIDDNQWARKDEKAIAIYYKRDYYLSIPTSKWINTLTESEEAEIKEQLKGF